MEYSGYWDREVTQKTKLLGLENEKKINSELRVQYKRVLKDLDKKLSVLYDEILNDDGTLNVNEFYKFNRYYELRQSLAQELVELGQAQIDIMDERIAHTYDYTSTLVDKGFDYLKNENVGFDTIVNVLDVTTNTPDVWNKDVWFKDGLSGAQRVHKSMEYLQKTVEKGLIDCVSRGASKDEFIKTLKDRFNVSFSEAQRLARTELSHTQNQAKADTYKKYGVVRYEYIAADDEKTDSGCAELDGQVFYLDAAVEGVNYPPMHPNCRCTTAPYIE